MARFDAKTYAIPRRSLSINPGPQDGSQLSAGGGFDIRCSLGAGCGVQSQSPGASDVFAAAAC